jgi:hypothetical protein
MSLYGLALLILGTFGTVVLIYLLLFDKKKAE